MKKYLYAFCASSALLYASTMLGTSMMTFAPSGYFDLYVIPFLVFYIFYFMDKYFFRMFLSISKTRAALGAGIINGVCAAVVAVFLYYFAHFSVQESISFMCIPDIYCALALQFQDMRPMPFYIAVGGIILLKLFILINVFEEKKAWIMPFIVLFLARIAQLAGVYYFMQNLHILVEYLVRYMPMMAVVATILLSIVSIDYICSLCFSSKEEDF